VRLLVFSVPADPAKDPWPVEMADVSLHTTHNLQILDRKGVGPDEILIAAWEGVFILARQRSGSWEKFQVGKGNQESKPFKGSSEVKLGKLADGRSFIATIEPWHGNQVVVYSYPDSGRSPLLRLFGRATTFTRHVIDEPVQWGHAVWCADLDGDGDDELIIGQRDKSADPKREPKGPGVFVYDPRTSKEAPSSPPTFDRHVIDDGGVGCEDLVAADLDGDGRLDILAGGRSTHNVKIYWNRGT
jgi:hypothetical protein